jgi:hypothetical protein
MSDDISKRPARPGLLIKGLKSAVLSADHVEIQPGALFLLVIAAVIIVAVGYFAPTSIIAHPAIEHAR